MRAWGGDRERRAGCQAPNSNPAHTSPWFRLCWSQTPVRSGGRGKDGMQLSRWLLDRCSAAGWATTDGKPHPVIRSHTAHGRERPCCPRMLPVPATQPPTQGLPAWSQSRRARSRWCGCAGTAAAADRRRPAQHGRWHPGGGRGTGGKLGTASQHSTRGCSLGRPLWLSEGQAPCHARWAKQPATVAPSLHRLPYRTTHRLGEAGECEEDLCVLVGAGEAADGAQARHLHRPHLQGEGGGCKGGGQQQYSLRDACCM